jgi:hypothetical protein
MTCGFRSVAVIPIPQELEAHAEGFVSILTLAWARPLKLDQNPVVSPKPIHAFQVSAFERNPTPFQVRHSGTHTKKLCV